jgi:chondroitin AC lyase
MKPTILILFVYLFSNISFAQKTDIQILRENLINDALINQGYKPRVERYILSDYNKAQEYLTSLNADGSWSDIDYADRDNNWAPLAHLDRILVMSFNYMKDTSQLYQNKKLLSGLEKSLGYWYQINPECDNWYKNRIAKQFYFNVIALLLEGKIDASLQQKMVNDLTATPTMTGSNRTLLATSTFYKGVLENNPDMILLGTTGVTDQIEISTKEGIQPDYSFHQHGHFIYNGSYGFNFLRESIWLATIVHGTKFAFTTGQIQILRDYYLEGMRWMIRGGVIDYNVRGRQVGRGDAIKLYGDLLIPIINHLIIADPEFQEEYKTSIKQIKNELPQNVSGNKHFWRSDYTIHHRDAYCTSLKMCSERTIGIELNVNSENKLGYWLPYGLTYIYRLGNEYDGIFPAWDWARLPGVTNPYIEIEEQKKGAKYTQNTAFVGGISNGKYGVSAMDFSKNETAAKKSWFWFDEEWVALGAGIESEHDSAIVTGINQSLRKGAVMVDGDFLTKNRQTLHNPNWILHDSIAYVFPGEENIEFSGAIQRGNMQRIYGLGEDTVYAKPVFSLWFNHGTKPASESYQYIVVPGTNENNLKSYTNNLPITILSNTKEVQAVSQNKLLITGVVFYKAGSFELDPDLTIEVDQPVIVLLDMQNKQISIGDPTAAVKEINISINNKNGESWKKLVELPSEEFAGKSITLKID